MSTATRALLAFTLVLVAAGCTQSPPEPLPPYLSPYPAGKYSYGYAEERLGPDTWRVIYHGPWQSLPLEAAARAAALERAAIATNELALLRAAQLAQAQNMPAFTIVDRRTDTDTQRETGGYVYDPYWPAYPPYYSRFGLHPYWHAPRWSAPVYVPGHAAGKARTTLVIRLARRVTPATIDARATAERLDAVWRGRAPSR